MWCSWHNPYSLLDPDQLYQLHINGVWSFWTQPGWADVFVKRPSVLSERSLMFLSRTVSRVTDLLLQTSDLAETKEEPGLTDTSEKILWRPLMKQEEPLRVGLSLGTKLIYMWANTTCLCGIWMLEKQLKRIVFSPNPKEWNLYYKAGKRKVGGQLVSCQGQDQTVQRSSVQNKALTTSLSKSLMNSCQTQVKSPLQEHQILFNKENGCLRSFFSSAQRTSRTFINFTVKGVKQICSKCQQGQTHWKV